MENKITKILDKIQFYYESKKYKKCLKWEKKIIPLIKNMGELEVKTLLQHGKTLYHLRKYREAIFYLRQSLNICPNDNPHILYEIHLYLFKSYYEVSDYYNIITFGIKTALYENIEPIKKAKIFAIVGRFYYLLHLSSNKKGYLIRGLFYNSEAIKLFQELNYTKTEDYLLALYDSGDIYYGLEDYDSAIKYYELIEQMSDNPDYLFGIYCNLIDIYKEKGYKDTMMHYKQKLKSLY
ncbi:MAG TPA: hypothetical protein VIK84_02300 [Haloplasmataceae bacterium]